MWNRTTMPWLSLASCWPLVPISRHSVLPSPPSLSETTATKAGLVERPSHHEVKRRRFVGRRLGSAFVGSSDIGCSGRQHGKPAGDLPAGLHRSRRSSQGGQRAAVHRGPVCHWQPVPLHNLVEDNTQLPWNANVPFIAEAAVNGSVDGGWQALPNIEGMTLNRTFAVQPGAVMPFYQTQGYDASKVKRAVMIMPGKPRDCWKYTSLVQNALNVYTTNPQSAGNNADGTSSTSAANRTAKDEVLILGPCWMNSGRRIGGCDPVGRALLARLAVAVWHGIARTGIDGAVVVRDGTALRCGQAARRIRRQRVVLGGQPRLVCLAHLDAAQREQRQLRQRLRRVGVRTGRLGACPTMRANRVREDKNAVVQAFAARNVHYNYGLLDNGQGDTSCEASYQGANHLERGCHFVESVAALNANALPKTHTANFMPNVSHEDYAMLSYKHLALPPVRRGARGCHQHSTSSAKGAATKGQSGSSSAAAPKALVNSVALVAGAIFVFGLSLL
ncbi:hypothetical protein L1887_58568 [Cichorium endivia]|nr:hypothetical protein L1887_58568 [Cichorium endivia]